MKQIKPYLFIIGFLLLPLLLIPIIRKSTSNFIKNQTPQSNPIPSNKYGLVIHGGAGNITKESISYSIASLYDMELNKALTLGYELIEKDSSAAFVVSEVIQFMENSPYFNAGKGSVLNDNGEVEMDASIMDGTTLEAGAVSGVKRIKNPIKTALAVMNKSAYVLLSGNGAERFAKEQNLALEKASYFITEKQLSRHNNSKAIDKHGTVGCVVLDKAGHIAAGTSTGGMANKKFGRIGDSPIIGAGTYANNATCGISCTGHGEYFIRFSIAYQVSSRMELLNESIHNAGEQVIDKLTKQNGTGGFIALDAQGNYTFQFNTPGMFRGVWINDGDHSVELFGNIQLSSE